MIKIKLFAALSLLSFAAIIFSVSPVFVSKAENDSILQEIAQYKNWQRISKEPIKSVFQIDGNSGDENIFIVDGQEVTNFRTGTLNG